MYYIDKIQAELNMAIKQRKCMLKAMVAYDKVCQDYEHFIETYKYNAAQGAKILAGLRDARVRRRFYKDHVHVMDSVINNLQRTVTNINASQVRAATHPTWKKGHNEDILAIIRMREKK